MAASEDERVAALESHHVEPGLRLLEHDLVDPLLGDLAGVRDLGDIDDLRAALGSLRGQCDRTQVIGKNDIRCLNGAHTGDSHQVGVTGATTDQGDAAGCRLLSISSAGRPPPPVVDGDAVAVRPGDGVLRNLVRTAGGDAHHADACGDVAPRHRDRALVAQQLSRHVGLRTIDHQHRNTGQHKTHGDQV